uniref:Uncharacterized protein n=1 Tax=Paramoeba aestuarina TaxID=180227 RepID=A0A7S4NRF0_9EUKA|mmetsp:Transcript_23637/g.36878  ORF Transcript_23637/g.36878 Transcript_23637/m.36878 type:complete len:153 (+) Transcript_23637:1018-1476(+)
MKLASLSGVMALLICAREMRCVDSPCTDSREYVAETETELEIATEVAWVSNEPTAESHYEGRRTWGQWIRGLIWGTEQGDTACTDAGDEPSENDVLLETAPGDSTEKKRNVKKIVVITVIVVVALVSLVPLFSLYLAKRGEPTHPSHPIVSA